MRIFNILALGLVALRRVAADCDCLEKAATAVNCDLADTACLCDSEYTDRLNTCYRRSKNDCTDEEIFDARRDFARDCLALAVPSSARASSRTSTTSQVTTSSSRSSRPASTSASTSTSASASASNTPTNTAVPSSSVNKPVLTTAQIGGIAGGGAGFIVILILAMVLWTMRKYKKKDQKSELERSENVEKFIEGGRQLRAASMTLNPNDRLYSTQRPLSYALGEYDSSKYDEERNQEPYNRHLSPDDTPSSATRGDYFNRFSGNYVEDSSQAFESRSSQAYFPSSTYRSDQRSVSVPMDGAPALPTASLSYEEYRYQAQENAGEQSSLIREDNTGPHRSFSAPLGQPQPTRISRKPLGNSLNERTSYYDNQNQYQSQYASDHHPDQHSSLMGYDNRRTSR